MKLFPYLLAILLLTSANVHAQTTESEFDPEKYVPGYTLSTPEGWGIERFAIPIGFAPAINYKGVEDIRFAPGWADPKSTEYWSYAFLWYLEGNVEVNAQITQKNLTDYYAGLVGRNIEPRKIPKEKQVPVKVTITETKAVEGDLKTFSGTVDMLDYMQQKPMTLNVMVHVRSCPGKNNTFVFYQLSPQPLADNVWRDLQKLWTSFDCKAAK